MDLPVNPPILPMLAKRVGALPPGDQWIFEPKWDGFRTLVFRDGEELFIQSRDEKPLDRYFPDLVETLKTQLPKRCVLDGEIVIATGDGLDFSALQMRLHPAASRVNKLAGEIPASIVFFDLLSDGGRDLRDVPFDDRRTALVKLGQKLSPPLHVTPATRDRVLAADWFRRFEGAGLDGVVAKAVDGKYEPNKRVMFKVKHERDCDCVVAGFRWHKHHTGTAVGSLLLGLYDGKNLEHVGVCASFTDVRRRELAASTIIHGKNGRRSSRRPTCIGGPARSAAGVPARICHGSHCAPSWSSRSRTITCRTAGSGIPRSFVAGARTRGRRTAPSSSSRSCPRTSWPRSLR